jgi:hypothetical protein
MARELCGKHIRRTTIRTNLDLIALAPTPAGSPAYAPHIGRPRRTRPGSPQ